MLTALLIAAVLVGWIGVVVGTLVLVSSPP
jgi:hypothetical protein